MLVYLDDVLVFSQNVAEHITHLEWVFTRLKAYNLLSKPFKCEFGLSSVEYLGHIIGQGTIKADPSKVAAIEKWPKPTNVKQT